jgi:hypothetical protein
MGWGRGEERKWGRGGFYDNQVIMRKKNHSFVMILLQFVFSFGGSQREELS